GVTVLATEIDQHQIGCPAIPQRNPGANRARLVLRGTLCQQKCYLFDTNLSGGRRGMAAVTQRLSNIVHWLRDVRTADGCRSEPNCEPRCRCICCDRYGRDLGPKGREFR